MGEHYAFLEMILECSSFHKMNYKCVYTTLNIQNVLQQRAIFMRQCYINSQLLRLITAGVCVVSTFKMKVFFYVGPPKESIFLTTFYGLYFSHQYTNITNYISSWDINHMPEGRIHIGIIYEILEKLVTYIRIQI